MNTNANASQSFALAQPTASSLPPTASASGGTADQCELCRAWVPVHLLRPWSPAMKPTLQVCDRCHPDTRTRDPQLRVR